MMDNATTLQPFYVLLYYLYTPIADPEAFREEHHLYCLESNLLGRIIVATEGINGTLSGKKADCLRYMEDLKARPGFEKISFKVDEHPAHAFQKLHVRVKPEIVHSGLHHIDPNRKTGKHVDPEEFQQMIQQEDVVVLDARSNYEHKLGKFKNAVTLNINHFREFPKAVQALGKYKKKKVLTICTGGVKCEKASAYLLEQGFKDVYQLHGGIIRYGKETEGEDFEGKCYVFDNRLAVPINKKSPSTISCCCVCQKNCERMVNCANPWCNKHMPLCKPCGEKLEGACSRDCQGNPDKRPYTGTGYYVKKTVGYNPYKGLKDRKKSAGTIKRKSHAKNHDAYGHR